MDYEAMLKEGRKHMPEAALKKSRFEIPKVKGHIQGNKTIISNFKQIAATLERKPEHLLKYVLKELATPGEIKPKGLILGRKVAASLVNSKLRDYADKYVLCPQCGKPDTKLVDENKLTKLKCTACGAETRVA
jgi:translation initiation factor 2 subunit 2